VVATLVGRYPVLSYLAATFIISWGGILMVVGPGGFPATTERLQALLAPAIADMLIGPILSGMIGPGVSSWPC